MTKQNMVQWVYSSRNNRELEERYDDWANKYDSELDEVFGWAGPEQAVTIFARHVGYCSRILDAGAGTGLVGEVLARRGYSNLIAIDISSGMLEEARKKKVYRELHRMVMGERLDFDTDSFDATISVGVMTLGHAPASSLDELVRVTKSSGHVVFTLRPDVYEESGFRKKHEELEAAGMWVLVEASERFCALPKGEPDVYHQVWVYRVI